MRKLLLVFLLAASFKSFSQCSISFVSKNGNSYTYTANNSQAYYWSAGSCVTINGSNTNQTVTVTVSCDCAVLNLVTFNGGACYPCSVNIGAYIEEDVAKICISESTPQIKNRGLYLLYDCEDNQIEADWNILEGTSNFDIVGTYTNTEQYEIKPKYAWMIGYNYTILAYAPGTSNLIASYVITIQDCDECTECRTTSVNSSFFYSADTEQLTFTAAETGEISIELIDPNTGSSVAVWKKLHAQKGKNVFSLSNGGRALRKNNIYLVRIITANQTVITDKIIY